MNRASNDHNQPNEAFNPNIVEQEPRIWSRQYIAELRAMRIKNKAERRAERNKNKHK